jgi:hypothetical protein
MKHYLVIALVAAATIAVASQVTTLRTIMNGAATQP